MLDIESWVAFTQLLAIFMVGFTILAAVTVVYALRRIASSLERLSGHVAAIAADDE